MTCQNFSLWGLTETGSLNKGNSLQSYISSFFSTFSDSEILRAGIFNEPTQKCTHLHLPVHSLSKNVNRQQALTSILSCFGFDLIALKQYILLNFVIWVRTDWYYGAIPNFATEKEQKRNFLDFNDVTLVVVDIKSERFVKSTCLQQDLFDMTMVTIMFDTKTSESESFIDRSIEGIINIMMEFHHF